MTNLDEIRGGFCVIFKRMAMFLSSVLLNLAILSLKMRVPEHSLNAAVVPFQRLIIDPIFWEN